MRSIGWILSLASVFTVVGCTESKQDTPPPGPPPPKVGSAPPGSSASSAATAPAGSAAPSAHVCAEGGGQNPDAESAPFFARTVTVPDGVSFCLAPKGEVLTYGEKGKLSMDEVCTTAFDGECEVYKRFLLKRVVTISYVDDAGKGANVEAVLSRFASPDGAFAMFTKRVVADGDAKSEGVPKPLAAGTAGAIGTGRAYLVRGSYLVELQYNSENETEAQLIASSSKVLTAIGKAIGDKLPGDAVLPPSAKALPTEGLVPNGISYLPKDVPGFGSVGPAAYGFYDQAGVRTRVLSIVRATEAEAKSAIAPLKAKGKPLAGVGDDAFTITLTAGEKETQQVDYVVARKGARIVAVGDEEFALKAGGKPVGAEALKERATKLVSAP